MSGVGVSGRECVVEEFREIGREIGVNGHNIVSGNIGYGRWDKRCGGYMMWEVGYRKARICF